jgi:hypothetical protein
MAAVTIFEIGSLFCGVAPTVNFLIFGRAVAGMGGAGSKPFSISRFAFFVQKFQFSLVSYPSLARLRAWKIGQDFLGAPCIGFHFYLTWIVV